MSKSAMYETFWAAIRRWRLPEVTGFFALALVSLAPSPASADDHRLRVMTQNLYVGSFFQELNAAVTANEFIAACDYHLPAHSGHPAGRTYRGDCRRDRCAPARFRRPRAGRDPAHRQRATGHCGNVRPAAILVTGARGERRTLQGGGGEPGLDAELPTALGFDVRLTLRDALIVRADLIEHGQVKLSNLQIRQYIAAPRQVTPSVVGDTEGYAAIDVTWRGRQFRFVTTHFDLLPALAVPQALELVQTAANTTMPVVLVCDCNANPDNPADPIFQSFPAYLLLKNAGFIDAFRTARPNDPGFTFGQSENLLNVTSTMSHRIDLVQLRGPFTIEDVEVVGASPADRLPLGLWPSDHAGVVATVTLRSSGDDAD